MGYKYEGTLKFNEFDGKFSIVDEADEKFFCNVEFDSLFEVFFNNEWIPTKLEIGNAPNGELIFKLTNTSISGNLDGVQVRMN